MVMKMKTNQYAKPKIKIKISNELLVELEVAKLNFKLN
jgi:hypothetical protein